MMAIASWVEWLAVPMPPPGPCEASAAPLHVTAATIGIAASAARAAKSRMHDDVMTISCGNELQKIRRQSTPVLSTAADNVGAAKRNPFARSAFMSVAPRSYE